MYKQGKNFPCLMSFYFAIAAPENDGKEDFDEDAIGIGSGRFVSERPPPPDNDDELSDSNPADGKPIISLSLPI